MSDADLISMALAGDASAQQELLLGLEADAELRRQVSDQLLVGVLVESSAIMAEGSIAARVRYLLQRRIGSNRLPVPGSSQRTATESRQGCRMQLPGPAWRRRGLVGLVAMAVLALLWLAARPQPFQPQDLVADIGGLEQSLPGGDQLRLDPLARVRLIDADTVLLQQGAVACRVQARKKQGFVVQAGDHRFRVLGTRFRVAIEADGIHLRVWDGRVRVDADGPVIGAASGVLLRDGHCRVFAADVIESFDMPRLQWIEEDNRVGDGLIQVVPGNNARGAYLECRYDHLQPGVDPPWINVIGKPQDGRLVVPDWARGLALSFRGSGLGHSFNVSVLDLSATGAEHYSTSFVDAQPGWQRIELPWSQFQRWAAYQHDEAIDDGFDRQVIGTIVVGTQLRQAKDWQQRFAIDQVEFLH